MTITNKTQRRMLRHKAFATRELETHATTVVYDKEEHVDVRELYKMFSLHELLKIHEFRKGEDERNMWSEQYGICKGCGAFLKKDERGNVKAVHDPMHWSKEAISRRFHNLTKQERAAAVAIARWLL